MPTFLHFEERAFASRTEPSATSCQQVMRLRISSPLKEIYLLIDENLMIDLQKFPVFAIYNSSFTEIERATNQLIVGPRSHSSKV
jgi:hypothetical protein